MLPEERLARINALAKKSKSEGLSPEEKQEQGRLRQEYLAAFRANFKQQLESIEIVDGDGGPPPAGEH